MSVRISRQKTTVNVVITAIMAMDSHTPLATYCRMRCSSRAPKYCATGMAKPAQMPMQKPSTRKLIEPVAPTPASAATPRKRPTIIVSTRLYSCWNSMPASSGSANSKISRTGDPCVKSFVI